MERWLTWRDGRRKAADVSSAADWLHELERHT